MLLFFDFYFYFFNLKSRMKFLRFTRTILFLGIIKLVVEVRGFSSEILVLFGDKNCIAGSLSSTDINKEVQEIKKDDLVNDMTFGNLDGEKSTMSNINELAQYNDISYSYELLQEDGPPHSKTFTIALYLGDETYKSDGKSFKKAQQSAASLAVKSTKYEHPPVKFKENEKTPTPTVVLNNLASKLGLAVEYSLITDDLLANLNKQKIIDQPHSGKSYLQKLNETVHSNDTAHVRKDGGDPKGPFTIRVDVNGAQFYGEAHSIQNAKHEAALKALQALKDDKNAFSCLEQDDNCKSNKNRLTKSPITLVHEAAQKRNFQVVFDIVDEIGPSHKKLFTAKCSVDDLEATGQGKSKKEAKKNAAENILPSLLLKTSNSLEKITNNQPKNNNKWKKKKKNKVIKNSLDKIDRLIDNVMDFVSSIGKGENDNAKKPKDDKKSPTNELLGLGKVLNLQIKFKDFNTNNENKATYYSVVELGLKSPSIICLGEGVNQKNAKDLASKYALNALFKLGFLDSFLDKSGSVSDKEEEFQKVWLNVVERNEKDEL
ncbi:unnamed protein product [Ceutorhynchus assimilis]|uniref:DRBM domain-containing protein n=1 Tax=Ceutorhynchus assimilis TaxID=467358 RepID=A0A9N9MP51_9CUCU|nr:unnamed protein product [Ceutorhynchus assimilis]